MEKNILLPLLANFNIFWMLMHHSETNHMYRWSECLEVNFSWPYFNHGDHKRIAVVFGHFWMFHKLRCAIILSVVIGIIDAFTPAYQKIARGVYGHCLNFWKEFDQFQVLLVMIEACSRVNIYEDELKYVNLITGSVGFYGILFIEGRWKYSTLDKSFHLTIAIDIILIIMTFDRIIKIILPSI